MGERKLFTMLMSKEDREKLETIRAVWGVPLATVVRICITAGYQKLGFGNRDPIDDLKK